MNVLSHNFNISFHHAIKLLEDSQEFRDYCTMILNDIPFDQYYLYIRKNPFAFFVKKWNPANITEDTYTYREYLKNIPPDKDSTTFLNKSKDAILLVPKYYPNKNNVYSTISNFMKFAPKKQKDNFWKDIGIQSKKYANAYINTHGDGVSYLHVRFEKNPKYLDWVPKEFL
jgi:hypothetical protein